jgi:hypothetical protein
MQAILETLIFRKVIAATQKNHERMLIFHLDNSHGIARLKE